MKVLHVIPYLGYRYGGTSKVVVELVEHLSELEIQVDIITTNANDTNKLEVPLRHWVQKNAYRIQYFDCWHRHDLIFSTSILSWLLKHIHEYDVIHTHTLFAPLITIINWLCQVRKVPHLATPHGMLESWALSYKAHKKWLYYQWFEKPILQRVYAIHALAASETANIREQGISASVFTIPNGIQVKDFDTLPSSEILYRQFPELQGKQVVLFLARIDPKKGLDLLAPAFKQLHHQFSQAHLVVAGPDSIGYLPQAQAGFAAAGCLQAVTFTGMLSGRLKLAALATAQVYVAPSYSEGFSMSVLEGMVSGLPCVITKGCNFPEAGTAQAARVVDINSDAIAAALLWCFQNPELAEKMGKTARNFILQNYTWQHAAAKLHRVYQDIVRKNDPTPLRPQNLMGTLQ
jgi:glycosyltransferase involved in cell wall biosynthesis